MSEINYFENVLHTKINTKLKIKDYFESIKTGKWQDPVLNYRTGKIEKKFIPSVTISGTFKDSRTDANLEKHSGILCIDCDKKDNPKILEKRELLGTDKFVYGFNISVGGEGLAIYFKINPVKHLDSFLAIEKYLADNYHIIVDQSGKNISRLRFVSYDPEIFINEKSEKWNEYLKKEQKEIYNFNPVFSKSDVDFCINQLIDKNIDITSSYHDWIRVGFSFASEFGESGRSKFHNVSRLNSTYNQKKCDSKYDNFVKNSTNKTKINTFFWLCKQAGIQIKQNSTKRIQEIGILRRKSIGKSGGCKDIESAKKDAIKYLTEIELIETETVNEVIDKIFELNESELKDNDSNEITQIYDYINTLQPKYNTITKKAEINGKEITDKISNTIYLNCREMFPKMKITKDLIDRIFESDKIPECNPILDFFQKNKHLKPKGNIEKLTSCFQIPKNDYAYYSGVFLKKWLTSIIASAHGTYSLLILVLIGDQATNKTNFFRNLLPDELIEYYSESRLDQGKDDEILMSQKLLIMDDEFGGKSKKEADKLKDLSSKQKITHRRSYGRYHENFDRIAVLCGTSNESEVINDTTGNRRIIPIYIISMESKYLLRCT